MRKREYLNLHTLTETEAQELADQITSNSEEQENGCMHYTGGHCSAGYPIVYFRNKLVLGHRGVVAADLSPERNYAMHLCNNKGCTNPAHIMAGTAAENSAHYKLTRRLPKPQNDRVNVRFIVGALRAATLNMRDGFAISEI